MPAAQPTTPETRWKPRAVVVLLLAANFLFLVPVGVLLIWLALAGQVDYWDDAERLLVAGLGLVVTLMCVALGVALIRYNILGRPRARIEPTGLSIGAHRFTWTEIDGIGAASPYGVPYLLVAIQDDAIGRLPLVDRTMMRLWPSAPDGPRFAWITEQQLGASVETALERVAPMGAGRSED